MTDEACESKLRSLVRSSVHPYPGNPVAIGRAVVYYAWAAREFSAGIKCRHCKYNAILPTFKVVSGFESGGGLIGIHIYSDFHHHLQLGSHDLAIIWQKK